MAEKSSGGSGANPIQWVLCNAIGFAAGALLINGLIFAFAPGGAEDRVEASFAPPGYIIGAVWTVLFALMGAARALVLSSGAPESARHARLVLWLALFCAAYPAYTLGLSSLRIGLVGNIATILASTWVAARIRSSSAWAAALVSAVIAWVLFATVLVIRTLQLNA